MKKMAAGQFKARCLAILDEVAATGESVVVTKRGRPVAELVPVSARLKRDAMTLRGSVLHDDDIVSPLDEPWEAAR